MEASKALQPMNIPEVWDRKSDAVVEFGRDLDVRLQVARAIASSGMTHHKSPEAVMTIALTAFEMGLPLMQALRGMYVADGKIAIEGHLMDALAIQRCKVTKTVHESTRTRCRMTLHRPGWDSIDSEFDLIAAKQAGLIRDYKEGGEITPAISRSGKPKMTWVQHTEEMLYWRALSKGLKRIAPDYFGGVYHLDELQEATEIQRGASTVTTNAELDALKNGQDADPDELSEAEVEQMAREINDAVKAEAITRERGQLAMEYAVDGQWAAARKEWDSIRTAVLDSMPAVQGSLLDQTS